MNIDYLVYQTISLIESDITSESMKEGYVDFLHRYINKSSHVHEDEIFLIKENINRFNINVIRYTEEQVTEFLKTNKVNDNESTYSSNYHFKDKKTAINSNDDKAEIDRLNEIIFTLKQNIEQAAASRDEWRKRAESAETNKNKQPQNNDIKFKQVKKVFSKMYHPDTLTGDKFEKLIKQEIFKEFWQVIESIEKNDI